jgi:pyruvate dehydrogenase E1 component
MATPMHDVFDQFKQQLPDIDPTETQEWMDSLDAVVEQAGPDRARFIIYKLLKRARQLQVGLPPLTQTRYINTISPEQEPYFPGDEAMELRIRRMIRWNALAMVLRANTKYEGIGGHLSTYASAASPAPCASATSTASSSPTRPSASSRRASSTSWWPARATR